MICSHLLRGGLLCTLLVHLAGFAMAGAIQVQSLEAFLHYGSPSTFQVYFDPSWQGFEATEGPEHLEQFRFAWTNDTGATLTNLSWIFFIDPDIARDENSFFNEYGEFISASLPVLAPPDAIAFSSWEIDEPEYVFGDIYTHAYEGWLDNFNGVPSTAPDDVSLALLFTVPLLESGQTMWLYGTLSRTDAAGLAHFDPDTADVLYLNGYVVVEPLSEAGTIPEPWSASLVGIGFLYLLVFRR